jgi:NADH-quinone oxidoreductase E subunit
MNMLETVDKILEKYNSKEELIAALEDIQQEFGFLAEDVLERVSKKLNIPFATVSGVATFYSSFSLKPHGRYHIQVCRGTACHIYRSDLLLNHLEKKLNIKAGEVTPDGKFSLMPVNCIGACAKAPTMMINEKVYGNLTDEKINKIIDSLK